MKKKQLYALLMPLLFLFTFFSQSNSVQAAEVGDVITRIYVTDADGNEITGDIQQYQVFRLNADFTLPDNTVKAGDITRVKIPSNIQLMAPLSFTVKDADGNIVANGVADSSTQTVTLTYTDYPETHSGVKGTFYFNARVDYTKVTTRTEIPLNFEVEGKFISGGNITFAGVGAPVNTKLLKSAWQNGNDPQVIEYAIAINRSTDAQAMSQVQVLDVLRDPSVSYVPGSFRIYTGTWAPIPGDWALNNRTDVSASHPVQIDGSRFTVDLGDIPQGTGIQIRYQARVSYMPTPGEKFYNDVKLTSQQGEVESRTASHTFYSAGGQAEGYVFTIEVNKVNETGDSLAGAVFDVIRVRSGLTVGQITTDGTGKGSIKNLLKDDYILREVTPPDGYIAGADVVVNPADFDSTSKIASKTIVNKKKPSEPAKVVLKATKTLEGRALADQEFEFRLIDKAKFEVIDTVKNDAAGLVSFKELTFTAPGTYTYTVKEVIGTAEGI